jgi:anaerobic ribonucleoside-triphosphate reductase activating protein
MIRVAGFNKESIVDGPGLRWVLFVQGCQHNCPGCHNPDTHKKLGGVEWLNVDVVEQLEDDLEDNPLIMGVTISGGEPFDQEDSVYTIVKYIKDHMGLDVWIYTGYEWDEVKDRKLARIADAFVTGKYIEELKTLEKPFVGSSNQEVHYVKVPSVCAG